MFVGSIIGGFFMPFFVAERKQLGGEPNAKLLQNKTALTGSKMQANGKQIYQL